jgi:hypothetical protein
MGRRYRPRLDAIAMTWAMRADVRSRLRTLSRMRGITASIDVRVAGSRMFVVSIRRPAGQ